LHIEHLAGIAEIMGGRLPSGGEVLCASLDHFAAAPPTRDRETETLAEVFSKTVLLMTLNR
jgi:hypothetical protein